MRRFSISIIKEETAAVAIIVGLLVTIFVGLLAIVVDVGYMYEMRRQLQSGADAAALAGMTDIINGGTGEAVALEYAEANDLIEPSEDLNEFNTQQMDEDDDGEIDAFQVTVGKPANLFFAGIFNQNSAQISAQARAKRAYLVGTRGMIPLMIPIIRPTTNGSGMRATVDDYGWDLTQDADGGWSGTFNGSGIGIEELANDEGPGTYLVDLTITNSFGVDQVFYDNPGAAVAAITIHEAGDAISDARIEPETVETNGSADLFITATGLPDITAAGLTIGPVTDLGGGQYRAEITAPVEIDGVIKPYFIDLRVGGGGWDTNAAVLMVKAPNSPISDIEITNNHWWPGDPPPELAVTMNSFDFYEEYIIKYRNGDQAEAGNFSAISFAQIDHKYPDFAEEHGEGTRGGSDLAKNIVNYPGEIHIYDRMYTEPGDKVGPVKDGFLERFRSCPCGCDQAQCEMNFDDWDWADRPENCRKLVTMPLVELWEPMRGRSGRVIVVEIGEFYVDNVDADANLGGRFVEFARGGTTTDDPPLEGETYIETVRLTQPDY